MTKRPRVTIESRSNDEVESPSVWDSRRPGTHIPFETVEDVLNEKVERRSRKFRKSHPRSFDEPTEEEIQTFREGYEQIRRDTEARQEQVNRHMEYGVIDHGSPQNPKGKEQRKEPINKLIKTLRAYQKSDKKDYYGVQMLTEFDSQICMIMDGKIEQVGKDTFEFFKLYIQPEYYLEENPDEMAMIKRQAKERARHLYDNFARHILTRADDDKSVIHILVLDDFVHHVARNEAGRQSLYGRKERKLKLFDRMKARIEQRASGVLPSHTIRPALPDRPPSLPILPNDVTQNQYEEMLKLFNHNRKELTATDASEILNIPFNTCRGRMKRLENLGMLRSRTDMMKIDGVSRRVRIYSRVGKELTVKHVSAAS